MGPASTKAPFVGFALLFALLFSLFAFNGLNVVEHKWFDTFCHDCEDTVFGRLVVSRYEGPASHGGLLGHFTKGKPTTDPEISLQLKSYVSGLPQARWNIYPPQVGLQGMVLGLIDHFLPPSMGNFTLFQLLVAGFNALLIAGLILWIAMEIGIGGALAAVLGLFYSSWLVAFGHNMYWVIGTCFAPMLVTAWGFRALRSQKQAALSKMMMLLFAAFFIRFCCGYEYVTTIALAAWVPVVFYACLDRWAMKRFIKVTLLVGAVSIAAFFVAFTLNVWMLSAAQGGGWGEAFKTILSHAEVRLGTPLLSGDFIDQKLVESPQSLSASAYFVVDTYLRGYLYGPTIADTDLDWPPTFGDVMLVAFFACIFVLVTTHKKNRDQPQRRVLLAVVASLAASFVATMSWHLAARQHSYIHYHLNFILWYMPFMFLFYALMGELLIGGLCRRWLQRVRPLRKAASVKKRSRAKNV